MIIDKLHRDIDFKVQRTFFDDILKTDCSICEWNIQNDISKDRFFTLNYFLRLHSTVFKHWSLRIIFSNFSSTVNFILILRVKN